MKYVALMMLGTTIFSLGWEGRFTSAYEAAARGDVGKAAVELTSSLQQALRDHDPDHGKRPQIR